VNDDYSNSVVDERGLYSTILQSQISESIEMIELEPEPEPERECEPKREPEQEPEQELEKADEVTYEIPGFEPVEAVEVTPGMEDVMGLSVSKKPIGKMKKKMKKVMAAKEPDSPLPEASSWY